MDINFATLSNHLTLIGIYCILALSLNLINGSLGTFSLGHHGFWAMGAYASGVVVWTLGSPHGSLWVFGLSFIAAMVAAGLFGLLVGAPCLRLRGDYLAIATLGFAEIMVICVRNSESWHIFGERGLGGAAGFSISETFRDTAYHISGDKLSGNDVMMAVSGGDNTTRQVIYLVLTWMLVALVFIIIRNLLRSGHGRAIMAIRDDQTAAELMGVNLIRYKVSIFVIGAVLAGLAGALFTNYRSTISPGNFPMMEGVRILLMCVLGGLGSMSGTLIAVFVLYSSEQILALFQTPIPFYIWNNNAAEFQASTKTLKDLWQVVFALLLVLLMLMRPNGLMGRRELSRQYFRDLFQAWRTTPFLPVATLIQFILLIAGLVLSGKPIVTIEGWPFLTVLIWDWPLILAFGIIIALQLAKRRILLRQAGVSA